ncbi:MAG: hypothetical protein AAB787_02330 [Patescibacteria group bacterium]
MDASTWSFIATVAVGLILVSLYFLEDSFRESCWNLTGLVIFGAALGIIWFMCGPAVYESLKRDK